MHRTLGNWLIAAARISLLCLVILAAAAYGLTREWTIAWFNIAAGVTFLGWLLGHIIALRWPSTGFLPWLLVILILGFGWGVTGLGYVDDMLIESDEEFPDAYYAIAAFGTFSVEKSIPAMIRTSALLALFLVAIDTFAKAAWGRALLATLVLTALGMVIFFYLQRTFGRPFLLRDVYDLTFLTFATYRYWGNAAAFLGLLWPLAAAVGLYAAIRRAFGWSLWMAAALLVFAALYLNISKAGHVLGVVGLALFALLSVASLVRSGAFRRFEFRPLVFSIILLPLAAIVISLFFAIPQKRWDQLIDKGLEKNPRTAAYGYFIQMVPAAGWMGYGPGTFVLAHWPFVEKDKQIRKVPFWVAHQDYLQTVIEWGYAGTALWGLLFVPSGMRLLVRGFRARPEEYRSAEREAYGWQERLTRLGETIPSPGNPLVQVAALTAVLVTALHAAVDFPMQIESLQFYFLTWIALGWTPAKHLG